MVAEDAPLRLSDDTRRGRARFDRPRTRGERFALTSTEEPRDRNRSCMFEYAAVVPHIPNATTLSPLL